MWFRRGRSHAPRITKHQMFLILDSLFPRPVCRVILLYEGRIEDAWTRTYVASYYKRTMLRMFGWRFSFYQALSTHAQFYANAMANLAFCAPRKKRVQRRFLRPYIADIQRYDMSKVLERRRISYAKRHKTLFVYIGHKNTLAI